MHRQNMGCCLVLWRPSSLYLRPVSVEGTEGTSSSLLILYSQIIITSFVKINWKYQQNETSGNICLILLKLSEDSNWVSRHYFDATRWSCFIVFQPGSTSSLSMPHTSWSVSSRTASTWPHSSLEWNSYIFPLLFGKPA